MKKHKKDIRRTLKFDNVKKIKLYTIEKGKRYRIIGIGKYGNDYHLVEIELK